MSKVCVFDHPLIQHKLSILRDEKTPVKVKRLIRRCLQEVAPYAFAYALGSKLSALVSAQPVAQNGAQPGWTLGPNTEILVIIPFSGQADNINIPFQIHSSLSGFQ